MKLLAVVLVAPIALIGVMAFAVVTIFSAPVQPNGDVCPSLSTFNTGSASSSAADEATAQQQAAGSASQQQNLDAIIGQVKAYGLPEQAAIDAVTAGLAESGLDNHETATGQAIVTNLDSVGVFQERPSQGWGTQQQILDVGYATDKWLQFLERNVPNWQSMDAAAVAQAVERSAYPQRYQQFVQQAQTWVQQEWGSVAAEAPVIGPPGGSGSRGSTEPATSPSSSITALCTLTHAAETAATSGLSAAAEGGLWPVQLPVPAPGWQRQISLPSWPASESASPPTAVSNQCVAGAEWAFDAMNRSTYRFPQGNGVDVARNAAADGLVASQVPQVGDVVSFSIPGSSAGHVALVIATNPTAFEVVEQNWLVDNGVVAQWSATDWDVRSVAWPNSSVVGFAGLAQNS